MTRTALILLVCQAAFAAAPVITDLEPRGAEQGHAFKLTIMGRDLGTGMRIISTLPANFTSLNGEPMSAVFLVEPKPEAAPGVYPIRLESSKGISNVLLFSVGPYPEMTEGESMPYAKPNTNDSIEAAQPIVSTPVTINGKLRGAERDVYRIHGKAAERLVFEIEARRCGSAIDPVLSIMDGNGNQLARSDDSLGAGLDARIDFTFPRDGNYYVEVHDARFSRQVQNFYRLKIGRYSYPEGIFPLGGKRGEITNVTFFGSDLKAPVTSSIDLRRVGPDVHWTRARLPDSTELPMLFAVSDLPEIIEPVAGPIPVPSVVNGRLSKPGEIDRYKVRVEPGEKLLFELQARELGTSRLQAIITAYDPSGKKIDSAGDKPLPEDVFAVQGTSRTSNDPFLNLTVPKDVHEITVTVDDLAERGGPFYGYRLITRRQSEDFQLVIGSPYVNIPAGGTAIITVFADRRGYDGPIQISIPDLPKGFVVDGGIIPRETVDLNNTRTFNRRGVATITAPQGAEAFSGQLVVWGEAKLADGSMLRRRALGQGIVVDVAGDRSQGAVDRQRPVTAPWLGFDLPAALADAPAATLELKQTSVRQMEEGARYEYEYVWKIRNGTPPKYPDIDVVGAADIRVIDFKSAGKGGTFAVTTTKATDPAHYDLYATGRVKTDSGDEFIVSRAIPFQVDQVSRPVSEGSK